MGKTNVGLRRLLEGLQVVDAFLHQEGCLPEGYDVAPMLGYGPGEITHEEAIRERERLLEEDKAQGYPVFFDWVTDVLLSYQAKHGKGPIPKGCFYQGVDLYEANKTLDHLVKNGMVGKPVDDEEEKMTTAEVDTFLAHFDAWKKAHGGKKPNHDAVSPDGYALGETLLRYEDEMNCFEFLQWTSLE